MHQGDIVIIYLFLGIIAICSTIIGASINNSKIGRICCFTLGGFVGIPLLLKAMYYVLFQV